MLNISRTRLDSSDLIYSVQKSFDYSHSTLISKTIRISIGNFILKPLNLVICTMLLSISTLLGYYLGKYNLLAYIFMSFMCYSVLVIAYISYSSYSGWKDFISRVVTDSDISFKWANQVYSKEKNAIFIANLNNSKDELVIASAAMIIGEEKNSKIMIGEETVGELSENQGLLTHVGVLPKYFGNGYGRSVVKACIEFAKTNSVKTIKLCTSSSQLEAVSLYKSFGFKITTVHELVPILGLKIMVMELNL